MTTKLLLVEDEELDVECFRRAIKNLDVTFVTTFDLEEAKKLAAEADAIVSDLNLSQGDSASQIAAELAALGKPLMSWSGSKVEKQLEAAQSVPLVCAVDKNSGQIALLSGLQQLISIVKLRRITDELRRHKREQ